MFPTNSVNTVRQVSAVDGLTITRFAHSFESGGGTERYLDDLDGELLRRHALTVVRLHLTRSTQRVEERRETIGRGTLVRIALPIRSGEHFFLGSHQNSSRPTPKSRARDILLYHPLVWKLFGAYWVRTLRLRPRPGQALGAGFAARAVLQRERVDLAVLHYFGGADADEVLTEALAFGVPTLLLNHYSNDRFLHLAIRKHVLLAQGVAGVNGLQVPPYLRGRLENLSDGIDTGFFRPHNARPLTIPPPWPVILLPARLVPEKGPLDLIRALAGLREIGLDCGVALAGRSDSPAFYAQVKAEIASRGLSDRVLLLGDLAVESLRDWYAASAVVAFPTYHHEGLGRVTVESQSMGTPVVAYATGGVADGVSDGETGFLVRTGDLAGLVARLREILISPALRERMSANGRKAAERQFSLAALAARHEQCYLRVIAEHGSHNRSGSVGPPGTVSNRAM